MELKMVSRLGRRKEDMMLAARRMGARRKLREDKMAY